MKQSGVDNSRFPIFRERFRMLQGNKSDIEFGKELGISRQTVGFYRNGDRIPDALGLRDIAKKCAISADYLLGLSDCPSVDDKARAACDYTGLSPCVVENIKSLEPELILALNLILESPKLSLLLCCCKEALDYDERLGAFCLPKDDKRKELSICIKRIEDLGYVVHDPRTAIDDSIATASMILGEIIKKRCNNIDK